MQSSDSTRVSTLNRPLICPILGLTDEPATECVSISENLQGSGMTSRENLAAALVACLDCDSSIRKSFSLLDGDTPLSEALSTL